MDNFSRNILVRLLLLFCVLAQTAPAMPHHHHSGEGAACFVAKHCAEHDGGGETDGKHRHDEPQDGCAVAYAGDEPGLMASSTFDSIVPAAAETAGTQSQTPLCPAVRHDGLQTTLFKSHPPLVRLHTLFIVRSIPGRAPTAAV